MDPIPLSDDDSSACDVVELLESNDDDVIEVCDLIDYKNTGQYDHIVEDSKLLGEFIEKCLELENTKGMSRVINRSLIPAYYSTTLEFRKSEDYTKVISKAIRNIDADPDHKFTHVKELCLEMQLRSCKLNLKLNRRQENIIRDETRKRRKRKKWNLKRRKLNESNNSCDDDNGSFEVPIVNLAETVSVTNTNVPLNSNQPVDFIEIEVDGVKVTDKPSDLNKENHNINKGPSRQGTVFNNQFSTKKVETCNTDNASQSLLKDANLESLQNNNVTECDNEVSSSEITSTVPENNDCIQGSQDSDLIVLDDVNNDMQTATVSKESNNVKPVAQKPVIADNTCKKSIKDSDEDVIVLDEDNEIITTTKTTNQGVDMNVLQVHANPVQKNYEIVKNTDLIVIDDEDDVDRHASIDNTNSLLIIDENKLLVPQKAEEFKGTTEDKLMARIKQIEADIAECKAKVTQLEEQEVDNDSMWSPYIQCEKYKEKIVNLYKELCKLTGERAIKRREVRLKAANAKSQLSVEKLENLINTNIGPDGLPHFPDFQEVLQCVKKANKEDDLGWNRNEVMREANALFTYCGRALQESRQRREWRDMLSLVKSEAIEDPADNDPELMARLQANRQTAVKRENDLLNRYTEMTYLQPEENDSYNSDSEKDSDSEDETDNTDIPNPNKVKGTSQFIQNNNEINKQGTDKLNSMEVLAQKLVEAVYSIPNVPDNGLTQTIKVNPPIIKKRCTLIRLDDGKSNRKAMEENPPETLDPTNILNHNFELVPKVVVQRLHLPTPGNSEVKYNVTLDQGGDSNSETVIEIKKEPLIDIQEELDRLGTDFTATVIDIQDPFLVIEVSSDSEDDDFIEKEIHKK